MRRRQVIASASLVGVSAGCLANPLEDESGSSQPEPQDHPEFPDSITTESVLSFVDAYEEATYHNQLLEARATPPDSLSAGCNATFDRTINDELYVFTTCYGTTQAGDTISEYVSEPRVYRVTEHGFQRGPIERTERRGAYPLYAYNFDETTSDLHLRIRPLTESETDSGDALEKSLSLTSDSGAEVLFDSEVPSETHELIVSQSDSESDRLEFEWELDDEFAGITLYVIPDGTIDVDTLPA